MKTRFLLAIILFTLLVILMSCNIFMYDNREIPPRQIPAMEHIYTKELPDSMGVFFPKAVLSGIPEDTCVLLIRDKKRDTGTTERKFLFLSRDYVTVLSYDPELVDPWYLMRHEQGLGFALPIGDSANRALSEISFIDNNTRVDLTNNYFTYGTDNSQLNTLSSARIPLYDFQNKRYVVLGYDDTNLGSAQFNTGTFTTPVQFPGVTTKLKDAFSFLNNSTFPNTSFWNVGSFYLEQAETLNNEGLILLRVAKKSALTNLTESYIFLFDTNRSTIVGPKRALIPLPSVLFKDDAGVPWVLQAASKDNYSTTFQLLDRTLAIKKKIVVYGNSVYPLGIQTISGVDGLVFLTIAARLGTPTLYLSLFFLPLSKLGGL